MSFGNQTINSFLDELACAAPIPGGGAASAVAGALAAGLVSMVAELSVDRPKYGPYADTIEFGRREGHRLAAEMIALANADAVAFAGFMAALGMARTTPEEIAARKMALAAAAKAAIEPPRSIVAACHEAAVAAERLAGRSNLGLASDLVVASRLAEGAAHGALANVLVNLPALGDAPAAEALETEGNRTVRSVARLTQATRKQVARRSLREPEAPTGSAPAAPGPSQRSRPMTSVESGPRLLRGGPIAAEMREAIAADEAEFRDRYGRVPTLAVVVAGADAPSAVYLQKILDGCRRVGIGDRLVDLGADATPEHMTDVICELNADPEVAGIIVQMPLPANIPLRAVIDTLDPAKDIDGIHPLNAGLLSLGYHGYLPATAHASVEILTRSGIELSGKHAVVVGRSNVVGKPAALLLLAQNATVTICHSRTPDLAAEIRRADVVLVAVGRAGLVTGDMLKPGAVVVDVGINVVGDQIVGDVDESAYAVASAITPVPGGVGPLTNAILLSHLMNAARDQADGRRALGAGAVTYATMETER